MTERFSRREADPVGRCIVCGGPGLPLASMPDVPVICNQLLASRSAALNVTRGDIALAGCQRCGHVYNAAYDPGLVDYTAVYENSLHFSNRYQTYADTSAAQLAARLQPGGHVVEIGCGSGDFLGMICRRAGCQGTGYDPSRPSGPVADAPDQARIVGRGFLPADAEGADLICSRHVLEHLDNPVGLLSRIADRCRDDTALFIEVPNGLFTIDSLSIWDVIYEHVSYFTPSSLHWALSEAGFEVERLHTAFGGQFLCAWARRRPSHAQDRDGSGAGKTDPGLSVRLRCYPDRHLGILAMWQARIAEMLESDRAPVIWGAGSKGIMFLNMLGLRAGEGIDWVVDINPRKYGAFVAGTGQEIVPPARLRDIRPSAVLIMNPEYRDEIADRLKGLGINVPLVTVIEPALA